MNSRYDNAESEGYPEEPPDDDGLVAQISERRVDALATYIEQHKPALLGFLRAITGPKLLAVIELDDLLQEVCTAAIKGLVSAPLDQYTPMQWIQEIARRRVVDAHRFYFDAQRRDASKQQSIHGASNTPEEAQGIEQWLAASMTSPSAALSQDIRLSRMQQAISELSEEQQAAIRLRYVDGLPTKEIAARLGKTDVAIRVLLSRSLRQLEGTLKDVKPTR